MRVAIIGGGASGLAAGFELTKRGVEVEVFERGTTLGGLAGSFSLDGGNVEKFYHFICRHDDCYFETLEELGLAHLLRWRATEMGQYYDGGLYSLGRPLDLLRFPHLGVADKVRYGYKLKRITSAPWDEWRKLDGLPVLEWLEDTFGEGVFRRLHEPLVRLKFGEYVDRISAAWMWARFHRLGRSRTRLGMREQLGFVEGGSQVVMDALGERIRQGGGKIHLGATVDSLILDVGAVRGIVTDGRPRYFDSVISTGAFPTLLKLVPASLTDPYWENLRSMEWMGIVCVFLRAKKRITKYFWTNVSDPRIHLPGFIEYTNLNPLPHLGGDSIVYLPLYLPISDPRFTRPDEEIIREFLGYLEIINPGFSTDDVSFVKVVRERYAQPVCDVGFGGRIPSIRTPVSGLYATDSTQILPDDRTISNSLWLGKSAASFVLQDSVRTNNLVHAKV